MSRIEANPKQVESSFLHFQKTLGLLFLISLEKLFIDIPKIRPINRVRITKHGVVIKESARVNHQTIEIPDDHTGIININGLNWAFKDRTSNNGSIKGEITIGGKMAKNGDRIHMRKGAKVEITQEEPTVERDGVRVRFIK